MAITTLGNISAYGIGFLFTPFIARLFPPEEYGVFALFMSIVGNLSLMSTLGLTNAIILPKQREEFRSLIQLIFISICSISIIVLLVSILLWFFFFELIERFNLVETIWLIVPFMILGSLLQTFHSWNVREKMFTRNVLAKIVGITSGKTTTLMYGIYYVGNAAGLMVGEAVVRLLDLIVVSSRRIKTLKNYLFFDFFYLKKTLFNYRNYPLFILPSSWLTLFIYEIPLYLMMYNFSSESTGHFAMANGILGIPLMLIGQSSASVFLQKSKELNDSEKNHLALFTSRFVFALVLLSIVPFGLLFGFGQLIFEFVLGEQWSEAGVYSQHLSIYFMLRLISFPLSVLFRVLRREKTYFRLNLLLFLGVVLILFLESLNVLSPERFVMSASFTLSIAQLIIIWTSLRIITMPSRMRMSILAKALIVIIAGFGLFFMIMKLIV